MNYFRTLFILSVTAALFAAGSLTAQVARRGGVSTEGRDFWVVFQKNFRDFTVNVDRKILEPAKPLTIQLFITSSSGASGKIEISGLGIVRDFSVSAGQVISIPIDTGAQLRSEETVDNLSIHITSDEPITVYGLSSRYQTTDTYLAYPIPTLGTSYRVMCYSWLENDLLAQFAVIATEDNTTVRITPTVRTQKGRPPGLPFEVKLNRGEVYQVFPRFDPNTPSDLTGSLVESDRPVAVFSGHNCAYVPDPYTKACNHLVEQMPPIRSWGKQFFIGTLAGRSSSVVRVLADKDNTHVFDNNRLVATLRAGQFYENRNQTQNSMITSDNPVLAVQFSKGFDNGDNVGDPMMIVVAPTEQFLSSYRFATPIQGSWNHYVNLIAPTRSIDSLRLDSRPIDRRKFRQFGISTYSIVQVEVPYGTHVLESSEPFGLYSYGFGYGDASYDAYGNGGGQSMETVVDVPDTIAPALDAALKLGRMANVTVRDDRLNDRGMEQITPLDYDNLAFSVPSFETGSPQVPFAMNIIQPRHNAYARFRLKDKAGNISYYTVCIARAGPSAGDTMKLSILQGKDASCRFPKDIQIGGYVKYLVMANQVTIPKGAASLNNPVELYGDRGITAGAFGAAFDLPYTDKITLLGRVGIDVLRGNVTGYFPDSLRNRAQDSTPVTEEFRLHRLSVLLTVAPGAMWYFAGRSAYAYGQLNLSLPLYTSEVLTRTILSPANYTYSDGTGVRTMYDGGDPNGFSLVIAPEVGLGGIVELRGGARVFAELGVGSSLTSLSPGAGWGLNYFVARLGAKIRF